MRSLFAILFAFVALCGSPVFAQKPPINGVAGPSTAQQMYSVAPDFMFRRYSEKYISPNPQITNGNLVIDLTLGNIATVQNSGNITNFSVVGQLASGASSFVIYFVSLGASNTQTWGGSVKWPNGASPILSSTITKIDMVACTLFSDQETWLCSSVVNF